MDTPLRLVLFFDFDGTLCDSATAIIRLMQQACGECGLPIPDAEKIRGNIGHGVSYSALDYVDGDGEKAAMLADCYRYRVMNISAVQLRLIPCFPARRACYMPYPGKGILTGIVTNKSRTGLQSLIERHGLDKLIDVSLTADDCTVNTALGRGTANDAPDGGG